MDTVDLCSQPADGYLRLGLFRDIIVYCSANPVSTCVSAVSIASVFIFKLTSSVLVILRLRLEADTALRSS